MFSFMQAISQAQVTSAVRWALTTVGTTLATLLVSKGYQSASTAAATLSLLGAISGPVGAFMWSMFAHSEIGAIKGALATGATVLTTAEIANSPSFVSNDKVRTIQPIPSSRGMV